MAWDGSGTFTRTNGTHTGATTWANSRDAGNNITATLHDLHDQDLADGIAACLTKNGETKPTADFRPNADNTYSLGSAALRWVNLVLSGFIGDSNGNELLKFSATASAVNEITVTNAATGNPPRLTATGGDTNIALRLVPKGTGDVQFADGTDTTKIVAIECSSVSTGTTRTLTVPDASTTIVGTDATQTLTNKTIAVANNTLNMAPITAALGGDVALNNTGNFFDGPSVAQGASGTWLVIGTVTLYDTAGACAFIVKLWDGTNVIASSRPTTTAANVGVTVTLAGYIASPAGNLRISVKDASSTSGFIRANTSGETKDGVISAIRIA